MNEKNGGISSARMGQMPEGKLLLTLAVPIMLSMLVQALYNIVDSIYVAQVSEDCLTALSLVFPAQNIMIGLATGTGVGVNALLSKSLGEKDPVRANRIAERKGKSYEWGWLQNIRQGSAAYFCRVGDAGYASYWDASGSVGVRPAFLIKLS